MTQRQRGGSRRVFLTLGGLTLLSACAKEERPTPAPTAQAPLPSSPPSPPPSPGPTPSGIPVQREPRYVVPASSARKGSKVVALTLDDGPDPTYTPQVLAILRKHHITATFFVIGQSAAAHPDLIRSVADAGHVVGTHTWSHANLRKLPAHRVKTEIGRAVETVTATTGRMPTLFRAPYGNWSRTVLTECAAMGQTSIAWNVDPRDWDNPGAAHISSKVLDQVGNRSIVLNHDGGGDRSQTVRALRHFIPVLIDSGYTFVGV
ncbi:polysaccharide deacetylase family protein [Couchioplanes caeruleus]|uniref:polysaccharide deacetylase family protein n=1 Tax=Couchioplanes caeruleus TaxID=56438 RepID=UPI0020BE0EAC|nr:polysaccharide deacetylase family protein [Couchioplanes caeruleus]UQU66362.1 polysaccharide deacetylase family protein [Couchioplanes caeruleus]